MSTKKRKQFMRLYTPVHAPFERFCKARTYGEMDFKDLMQETIAIAFEKLDELKNTDAFLHFLFGISVRVLSNNHKKKKEERWMEHVEIKDTGCVAAEKQLEIEDLYKALGKLSADQREAIILFEISGFSTKEVAEIQNVSVDAVKKRLSRGRQELTLLMSEDQTTVKMKVS